MFREPLQREPSNGFTARKEVRGSRHQGAPYPSPRVRGSRHQGVPYPFTPGSERMVPSTSHLAWKVAREEGAELTIPS